MPKEKLERALGFFEVLMKMLHPFMPFITEEIWQQISQRSTNEALTISRWPEIAGAADEDSVKLFGTVQSHISAIRNIQAEMYLAPKAELTIIIKPKSEKLGKELLSSEWIYRKLLPVGSITCDAEAEKPKASAAAVVDGSEIFIPLEGLIDLDKERERIQKEIDRLTGFMKSVDGKLGNKGFVENAPAEVVEKERRKKADAEESIGKLKTQLAELDG